MALLLVGLQREIDHNPDEVTELHTDFRNQLQNYLTFWNKYVPLESKAEEVEEVEVIDVNREDALQVKKALDAAEMEKQEKQMEKDTNAALMEARQKRQSEGRKRLADLFGAIVPKSQIDGTPDLSG